jgi:hypothetical protein
MRVRAPPPAPVDRLVDPFGLATVQAARPTAHRGVRSEGQPHDARHRYDARPRALLGPASIDSSRGRRTCAGSLCLSCSPAWPSARGGRRLPELRNKRSGGVEQRGQEVRLIRCGLPLHEGFRLRGKVVGAHPQLIDTVGEPTGKWCLLRPTRKCGHRSHQGTTSCASIPGVAHPRLGTSRSVVEVVADEPRAAGPALGYNSVHG